MAHELEREYLTAAQVRQRYGGVSRMWIHRRLAKHEFPKPITFGGRARYFKLADIKSWEEAMIARSIRAQPEF